MPLEQLVYISRANFNIQERAGYVEPEVGRILVTSRKNNARRGVVGALHYSDGYFFQVLEGLTEELNPLYEIISADPRHSDLKILGRETIQIPRFIGWSMKYGVHDEEVQDLLKRNGHASFNPYTFDERMVADMLSILQTHEVDDAKTRMELGLVPPAHGGQLMLQRFVPLMSGLALILSAIALYRTM